MRYLFSFDQKHEDMKPTRSYIKIILLVALLFSFQACTNLSQHVYSVTPIQNFYQTPDQIAAGLAPAYQALTAIAGNPSNVFNLQEVSSDEVIVPTRGADWYDNAQWQQLWLHTWPTGHNVVNGAWGDIYNGIGKINFILSVVNGLPNKPATIGEINAELKVLRAYFYYLAMDLFGNVPLVTDFNTNPNTVTNSARKDVFNFIESEIKANIDSLPTNVDASTYGRVTKWMAFALLAKIYLNAQVYTGTPRWTDCIAACDSIINSGKYSLLPNYFDNFAVNNSDLVGSGNENIFVVPFDKTNIGGDNMEMATLHYQSDKTFGLSGSPWNGFSSTADYYAQFDTSSTYTTQGNEILRTYKDQRTGQFLIGQQYAIPYNYPPSTYVYWADPSLALKDAQTGLMLKFSPYVLQLSNPADTFRLAGLRNIKYFPEAGTAGSQSNDVVLFRYADILLMKAECEVRLGTNLSDALMLVNKIRERAYGNNLHDWALLDLTLDNILAERARELAWEGYRRQDLIRFEVASGTPYFSGARTPAKPADPADHHLYIYPIPAQQITANPNLKQNPGY